MTKPKNTPADLIKKTAWTLKNEGVQSLLRKTKNYTISKTIQRKRAEAKDILFINGCTLPHPERYRVDHQIEQLKSRGWTVDKVFYEALDLSQLKFYRAFVFFRCPITNEVRSFIERAHYFNKTCFFDIDDLVINRKYTDQIPFVASMNQADKSQYDDGVYRMEQTLQLCDCLITSTPVLARELSCNYQKEVFVNRNVASEEMFKLSLEANRSQLFKTNKFIIGYLSGSITHNPDFELIKPAILQFLERHDNAYLEIMGYLDLPPEFKAFENRIIRKKFTDWHKLPQIIAELDVNLAPLEKSIFNEAKSENKWTEAALVKTITIASNFGAFADVVQDKKTGLLADSPEEWLEKLEFVINNPNRVTTIVDNAFAVASQQYLTTRSGKGLSSYIAAHLSRNIGFVLPTTNISGGVNVVLKHSHILREHGYDVSIISMAKPSENIQNSDGELNVISSVSYDINTRFHALVATLWTTTNFINSYPSVNHRFYLVQNFETGFAEPGHPARLEANATYCSPGALQYLTISKWCKAWLKQDFDQIAKFAPNGLNLPLFPFKERKLGKKIKILIEGNSIDHYKNVDESFRIVECLDKNRFEISYLSYQGEPKSWYHVDHFYHRIPHAEVGQLYAKHDILLKSSLLESFSYPPLEMMATGGFAIVAPNAGNAEYLKDRENCLLYEQGNIDDAVAKIHELISDRTLQQSLSKHGRETAESRAWEKLEDQILKLYES
ncbi:glycosyltransferase [Candidatus Saccharibacteria bacterium]|nr:glycosyltransferase [Candidatus Saccharibacteria bacterium]MBQ6130446.1 glycosyltransferase [Candidatus Saccharibacteria bacterium]